MLTSPSFPFLSGSLPFLPGSNGTRSGWRVLALVVLALLVFVGGCGSKTPVTIVQQALTYEVAHPLGIRATLVGSDALATLTTISDVRIKQDRQVKLTTATDPHLSARHLVGTYTLSLSLPGERRRYRRFGEPFQLTLTQLPDSTTWLLAYPQPDSDPQQWITLDFLPQPTPLDLPATAPEADPSKPVELRNEPIPAELSQDETLTGSVIPPTSEGKPGEDLVAPIGNPAS